MSDDSQAKFNASGLMERLTNYIFLPRQYDYGKCFKYPSIILITILIILLVTSMFPPVVHSSVGDKIVSLFGTNQQVWKEWLTFLTFLFEVIFMLLLGGSIFSEWITEHFKELVNKHDKTIEQLGDDCLTSTQQELKIKIERVKEITAETRIINFIPNAFKLFFLSREIYRMIYSDVTTANLFFIFTRAIASFPGGLLGVIAFVFFFLLSIIKVLSFYCERVQC